MTIAADDNWIKRNFHKTNKREYAAAFIDWMRDGEQVDLEPTYDGMSYMAAQAIRMRVVEYLES